MSPAKIDRIIEDGVQTVRLRHGGVEELFITAVPGEDGDFLSMFKKTMGAVKQANATILRQDVFGIPALRRAAHDALDQVCGSIDWPVTWLEEGATGQTCLVGTHLQAVAGVPVQRIRLHDHVVGSVFDNDVARYCRLGDVRGGDASLPREEQARLTFDDIVDALAQAEMDFSHVARTWLYLEDLLDWYDEFNDVRSTFFEKHNVFDGIVPASTGIGGSNHAGAAIVADVLAVKPSHPRVKIFAVPSPLQCPALDYGSSFSRAVEVDAGDHRRLLISGTASIAPEGETLYVDDIDKQIELTMDVVLGILESRGMTWNDTTRAIAYIKDGTYANAYNAYCVAHQLDTLPTVIAENDVCRDDLLFEIEIDAISTTPPPVSA